MEDIPKINSNLGTAQINRSTTLGDDKMPSPSESARTESFAVERFSPHGQGNGQEDETIQPMSQQLSSEDKMSTFVSPVALSGPFTQSSVTPTPVTTSLKTEDPKPLANAFASGSPGSTSALSSQVLREDSSTCVDPKAEAEDMDDVSSHSSLVPSHINPAACQDDDSQLSYNQESQSSESSLFSVRWPKVCFL